MRAARAALAAVLLGTLLAVPAAAVPGDLGVPLRIMALGDSLTIGYGSSDRLGYRRELSEQLNAAGTSHLWAGSATGRVGWTVQDLRASIDGWMAADQPDLVLLSVGTNNAAGVPPGMAGFEPALIALVNRILALSPTVRVAIAQVLYSNAPWSPNLVWVNVAAIHAAWWAQPAGRTILVDFSVLHPCRTWDGVHLRDDGYDAMARQWYRALAPTYGWPALTYLDHLPAQRRPGIPGERTATITC